MFETLKIIFKPSKSSTTTKKGNIEGEKRVNDTSTPLFYLKKSCIKIWCFWLPSTGKNPFCNLFLLIFSCWMAFCYIVIKVKKKINKKKKIENPVTLILSILVAFCNLLCLFRNKWSIQFLSFTFAHQFYFYRRKLNCNNKLKRM